MASGAFVKTVAVQILAAAYGLAALQLGGFRISQDMARNSPQWTNKMRKIALKLVLMALWFVVMITTLAACSDFVPINQATPEQQREFYDPLEKDSS